VKPNSTQVEQEANEHPTRPNGTGTQDFRRIPHRADEKWTEEDRFPCSSASLILTSPKGQSGKSSPLMTRLDLSD
jgi:hypothetical protein